jgi:hypothetical protein
VGCGGGRTISEGPQEANLDFLTRELLMANSADADAVREAARLVLSDVRM